MRNSATLLIALLALVAFGGTGCSRAADSAAGSNDVAVLDRAYRAGVLNQDEYGSKKAALQSQAEALAALAKALTAGTLTQSEYQTMKSRLIANASLLAALENARRAGVLSEKEYLAKKSVLTANAIILPAPAPPPVSASNQKGQPAAAPIPATAPSSAGSHVLRMKMVRAMDQSGFERPMPSLSLLVPTDWQSQGGTTWNIKDKCNTIQTNLRLTGPDGRGIEFFPTFNWMWADDPKPLQMTAAQTAQYGTRPCDVAPPLNASDFLRRNLKRYRPNAQLVGFEPAPKLMAVLQQQARQGEKDAVRYNLKQSIRPDVIKGRVKYTVNGQAMEEWIFVVSIITGTLGPSFNARTMQMDQAYTYSCVAYVTGERAPEGQLNASEKLFDLVVGTYRINPEWQAKVNGNAQAIQAIELKGVRDRSAIVTKNADEIAKIQREGYENAQRSQDRISTQFSQNTRDVETYRNPATGETVDLSNQYGQAWINNRGEYLLSDQPGFDPSVTLKEDWKPLEKVKN